MLPLFAAISILGTRATCDAVLSMNDLTCSGTRRYVRPGAATIRFFACRGQPKKSLQGGKGLELRDRRGKGFSVLQFTRYVESSYSVHGLVQYLVLQGLYSYCSYHRKYPCYHCPNRHHNYNHCCPCVCRLCLEVVSSWQALCTAVDIGQAWCRPQKTSLAIRISLPSSATNSSRRKAAERFRQDACQIAGGEIVATCPAGYSKHAMRKQATWLKVRE